jgi:hypothetical protein
LFMHCLQILLTYISFEYFCPSSFLSYFGLTGWFALTCITVGK